jgi:hypothetical protein
MREQHFPSIQMREPTPGPGSPEREVVRTVAQDVRPTDGDAVVPSAPRAFKRQIDCSPDSAHDFWGAARGR